jgi:hypothetical protein
MILFLLYASVFFLSLGCCEREVAPLIVNKNKMEEILNTQEYDYHVLMKSDRKNTCPHPFDSLQEQENLFRLLHTQLPFMANKEGLYALIVEATIEKKNINPHNLIERKNILSIRIQFKIIEKETKKVMAKKIKYYHIAQENTGYTITHRDDEALFTPLIQDLEKSILCTLSDLKKNNSLFI